MRNTTLTALIICASFWFMSECAKGVIEAYASVDSRCESK